MFQGLTPQAELKALAYREAGLYTMLYTIVRDKTAPTPVHCLQSGLATPVAESVTTLGQRKSRM